MRWKSFLIVIIAMLCMASDTTDTVELSELAESIQTLQPRVGDVRAERLARIYEEAGEETLLDPKLLIAVTFRESSFHPAFENGTRRGISRNEIGLMQLHGAALRFRPDYCTAELVGARCQIFAGANYLAYAREHCGGGMLSWIAAYGTGQCLSEDRIINLNGVRNFMRYYQTIGGEYIRADW